MSKLVLVSGDLMLGARVEGAARQCGLTMVTAAGHAPAIAASADECRAVLIDLRTPGLDVAELVNALRRQGFQYLLPIHVRNYIESLKPGLVRQ